jgi:hypothetical protein
MGSKINGRWKKRKKPEGEKQAGVSSGRFHAHLHCWTKQSRCAFALLVQHVPFQFISCLFILLMHIVTGMHCLWFQDGFTLTMRKQVFINTPPNIA